MPRELLARNGPDMATLNGCHVYECHPTGGGGAPSGNESVLRVCDLLESKCIIIFYIFMQYFVSIIGASLSEPHISELSSACVFACTLNAYTFYACYRHVIYVNVFITISKHVSITHT